MTQEPETQTPSTAETAAEPTLTVEPVEPVEPPPTFGFSDYAETINGRFAMIGLVILLGIELVTHQDLFTWLGLR